MTVKQLIEKNHDYILEMRREFHRHPELSCQEERTSRRICEELEKIGIFHTVVGNRNVVGIINPGAPGKRIAIRGDIDALPITEETGLPFASENPGVMHACGHDMHIAILLGTGMVLNEIKDQLTGSVKLIFQPAEETFNGAQSIIDKGHLDDVEYFIAMHVALSAENRPLPSNTIACGCKDFLSDRQLDVTFHGRAAHPCGAAQEGKNALLAACTAALNLHAIAPHEEGLCRVNVGELYAGVAPNTIAPNALMKVEYRGQTPAVAAYAGKRVFDILDGAAKAYDMTYTYLDYGEVPAGKSDDAMMAVIERAAKKVPWFEKIYFEGNVGGTDDAAAMLTKVQQNGGMGTYIGIGSDTTQPVHNAEFDIDEDCIDAAIDLCMFALEELHGIG